MRLQYRILRSRKIGDQRNEGTLIKTCMKQVLARLKALVGYLAPDRLAEAGREQLQPHLELRLSQVPASAVAREVRV